LTHGKDPVMTVIKPRTRGKQLVLYRTRLDRENHETLYAYAAFIGEDVEYVINQLIARCCAGTRTSPRGGRSTSTPSCRAPAAAQ
jgi:hypothetical protein